MVRIANALVRVVLGGFCFAAGIAVAGPIENLQPGEWLEVPNTHMSIVVPNPAPPGDTGPSSIVGAWSGGAYDTKRDRLLVWGGGHADYGGNEVYAFDINTLTWSRIWGPSPSIPPPGGPCVNTYSDGSPVSRHTYVGLNYLSNLDKFWIMGGSLYCGAGGAGHDTWTLDLTSLQWVRKSDIPVCCVFLSPSSDYDRQTGHVLFHDYQRFWDYDPVADTWTEIGGGGPGVGGTGALDAKRRKFYFVGGGQLWRYDLNQPHPLTLQSVACTGDNAILGVAWPGLVYDPVADRLVAWGSGRDVFLLNLDTMVWTRRTPAPTNTVTPTAPTVTGTYGRFRYIPSKNVYILVNSINENVFFYRLSSGTPAPVDTIAPSSPQQLHAR